MSTSTTTVTAPLAGGSGSDPGAQLTQAVWAAFLIAQINGLGGNVPYTLNNVQNIERWMAAEEPPTHWWNRNNPLNASLGTSATDGTGSYANLNAGAVNTARMILQSNMSGIYSALAANAPTPMFSAAVVASPWASSHYGGDPNHIANVGLPSEVSAGTVASMLPADPELGVLPASPTPLGPLGAGVNVGGGLTGLAGLEQGVDTLLGDLTSANFWKRVGIFVGGGLLVIVGIVIFVSTTKTGQKVESDAVSGATTAAVAA